RAGTPELDLLRARDAGLLALADHRGDHVRRLEVEVVAGAVHVRGEQVRRCEAELLLVGREAGLERALGDAVGRVRLLGESAPEVRLVEGDRRELRVRA